MNVRGPNRVRINSGRLRGRVLSFSDNGVRPTKSAVRKTLFNWLRPVIAGRICLDCFSGSGVLAMEALSEGAGRVVCLDGSPVVVRDILKSSKALGVDEQVTVARFHYPDLLGFSQLFDLVFLDPPFDAIDINEALCWLGRQRCMREGCLIYIECPRDVCLYPMSWVSVVRRSRAADVDFYLLAYNGGVCE